MAEVKRVPIQTLEFSSSLGNATKKEKKEKDKQPAPSFRFELLLDDKNEKEYFEFNYGNLLKAAKKKKGKEIKSIDEFAVNGLDPFDDDDDEKLKEIAKKFEAKYGTTNTPGKAKKKYDDDVDLGAGYDENDSFIDNTDAYDEVVPEGVTTAHGGFYINSGPLEFSVKENYENSLLRSNHNDDESSESSDDDDEDSNGPDSKRRDRDINLIMSSDDDTEEVTNGPLPKKAKLDENTDKKSNYDNVLKKKKKTLADAPGDSVNKQKPIDDKRENMEVDTCLEHPEERKKLESGRSRSKDRKLVKKSVVNGLDEKKIEVKKSAVKEVKDNNGIDDAIESVVNDGKIDDESSRDTVDSGKSRCIAGTSSECEDTDKVDLRMPDNLPEDIKDIIVKLKKHAGNSKEGKIKFFDTFVNDTLLSLEKKLRVTDSPTMRSQVYGHLAHFLSCSKTTLSNRAKKLCLQDAEVRIKEPLGRLKTIVDRVMATVLPKYEQCQKMAEEKSLLYWEIYRYCGGSEASLSDDNSSDINVKSSEKLKTPRKRFPWSNEAKKLVYEIANIWRQYYKIRKPRKESIESFVASLMESKLLPLWPEGWMRIEILMTFSNLESIAKRKQKKSRDISVPNEFTSVTSNYAEKSEMASINTKLAQERAKSPVYYDQVSLENTANYTPAIQTVMTKFKDSELAIEKKQINVKHKDKINENSKSSNQHENSSSAPPLAKISLVPTSQLMAQKPTKTQLDKFNPIDLTSSSLSITPVNDYQKIEKLTDEVKKDTVSITTYAESSNGITVINDPSNPSFRSDVMSFSATNQTSVSKPVSLKQRILQESVSVKVNKRIDDRERDPYFSDQKERKRDRWVDDKYKSSYDIKKRRKDHKIGESSQQQPARIGVLNVLNVLQSQSALSKEEQEKRQIEETMAATNYLSQIINDDIPRSANEKKKDLNLLVDDGIGSNIIQPSEQEKDVQMVMRSLKELQELQEMKISPNHSPLQKPSVSNQQYIGYADDYNRLYHKKDEKIRLSKDESHW